MDNAIKKIHEGRALQCQFQKVAGLKKRAKEAELFLHLTQNLLKQVEEKLAKIKKLVVTYNSKI